jgi:phosphatidylethanolamine-binding protein (PEBP) family uncharacterized protein
MRLSRASRIGSALALAAGIIGLSSSFALSMSASFTWAGIAACEKVSPSFMLKDVPAGTQHLRFVMHDKDAPHFEHGGSTIAYAGLSVASGAITYIGPCPPEGSVHHYVWTIEALDGNDKVLAKTTASGAFPMQ